MAIKNVERIDHHTGEIERKRDKETSIVYSTACVGVEYVY